MPLQIVSIKDSSVQFVNKERKSVEELQAENKRLTAQTEMINADFGALIEDLITRGII